MSRADLDYYTQRCACELGLAESAKSPQAASAHRMLAEIYSAEIERLTPAPARRGARPEQRALQGL